MTINPLMKYDKKENRWWTYCASMYNFDNIWSIWNPTPLSSSALPCPVQTCLLMSSLNRDRDVQFCSGSVSNISTNILSCSINQSLTRQPLNECSPSIHKWSPYFLSLIHDPVMILVTPSPIFRPLFVVEAKLSRYYFRVAPVLQLCWLVKCN